MTDTIIVRYSCQQCGAKSRLLEVPARGATELIRDWMPKTIGFVAADHRNRSPQCEATVLTELMIPAGGRDNGIGRAPVSGGAGH